MNMVRVATWCSQNYFTERASMFVVVQVLEGDVNVESNLNYFLSNLLLPNR